MRYPSARACMAIFNLPSDRWRNPTMRAAWCFTGGHLEIFMKRCWRVYIWYMIVYANIYIYTYTCIHVHIYIYIYGAASQGPPPLRGWSCSFLPLRLSTLSSFPSPRLWPVVVCGGLSPPVACVGGVYVYMIDMLFIYVCGKNKYIYIYIWYFYICRYVKYSVYIFKCDINEICDLCDIYICVKYVLYICDVSKYIYIYDKKKEIYIYDINGKNDICDRCFDMKYMFLMIYMINEIYEIYDIYIYIWNVWYIIDINDICDRFLIWYKWYMWYLWYVMI